MLLGIQKILLPSISLLMACYLEFIINAILHFLLILESNTTIVSGPYFICSMILSFGDKGFIGNSKIPVSSQKMNTGFQFKRNISLKAVVLQHMSYRRQKFVLFLSCFAKKRAIKLCPIVFGSFLYFSQRILEAYFVENLFKIKSYLSMKDVLLQNNISVE